MVRTASNATAAVANYLLWSKTASMDAEQNLSRLLVVLRNTILGVTSWLW